LVSLTNRLTQEEVKAGIEGLQYLVEFADTDIGDKALDTLLEKARDLKFNGNEEAINALCAILEYNQNKNRAKTVREALPKITKAAYNKKVKEEIEEFLESKIEVVPGTEAYEAGINSNFKALEKLAESKELQAFEVLSALTKYKDKLVSESALKTFQDLSRSSLRAVQEKASQIILQTKPAGRSL